MRRGEDGLTSTEREILGKSLVQFMVACVAVLGWRRAARFLRHLADEVERRA